MLETSDFFLSSPRTTGRGGGLASVFKKKFDCRNIKNDTFSSFEEQLMQIDSRNPVLCVLVYRPPKINKNFIHEFTGFLGGIMMKYDRLVILGDFNIHICCSSNGLAREFLNLIDAFNLVQSVTGPTHKLGHTLDLVLSYGLTVCDFEIMETVFSDHKSVVFNMSLSCSLEKPCVSTRWCRIMNSETSNDFCTMYEAAFSNSYYDCSSDLCADELLSSFTSVCSNILDSIAPLKTRCFKSKSEPWLNNSTCAARRLCRRAERKWKKDKLQVSYEIFKNRLTNYQKTIKMARVKYFSGLIEKNRGNPRFLFSTLNAVINPPVSEGSDVSIQTCENFCIYFLDKISDIRSSIKPSDHDPSVSLLTCPAVFHQFEPVSITSLTEIVKHLRPSTSPQDIIPTRFLKQGF